MTTVQLLSIARDFLTSHSRCSSEVGRSVLAVGIAFVYPRTLTLQLPLLTLTTDAVISSYQVCSIIELSKWPRIRVGFALSVLAGLLSAFQVGATIVCQMSPQAES